ncbi:Sporulation stage II protein D, amidase enhancer LytB [Moorella glycerini]|uniref:Amidase enhancer n=1 Tax=Neomoorella stamsii TaxID=1266720 RepID=A0A9X7IZX3_9FIRM|nr:MULTISPECIES: SpoIID/LytB domain-containing protein [Moorella]PRR68737.1 Amidase enhancer precursor [Moorella stamsii]CEP68383.1 Sporulation stage II protein D, amidase enhancer LytB [Moorella glycerini]
MALRRKVIASMVGLLFLSQVLAGCRAPARRPAVQEPTLSLYVNQTGEVKRLKIEEYLPAVVAAEMEPSWPLNALAAQAILARTFTMKKIQEGGVKAHGTDASTSVEEFQAYNPARVNDNVRRAVEMTRGQVIKYKGNYINAWFHASGGPRTAASAVEGLNFRREPAPYIQSVPDPGMAITTPENKSWTATFNTAEVAAAVRKVTGQDPGTITAVSIAAKGPSGRATQLKVGKLTVDAPALRLALGSDRLRSTLLTGITTGNGRVTFKGEGYGHGVGMSQWGAKALAEQGKSPQEIIKYFFKDVELVKAW